MCCFNVTCNFYAQSGSFNWCSFTGQQDLPAQSATAATSGAYPAVLPRGVLLWKKPQITVAFTNKTIGLLDDWGLDVGDILSWANRWHDLQEEPKYIPKFIGSPTQGIKGADIIVELNGNSTPTHVGYTCPSIISVQFVHF